MLFYDTRTKRYCHLESEVIDQWLGFIDDSSRWMKVVN